MTRKLKTITAVLMTIMLILAMTACGSKEEPAPEQEPEVTTEEMPEEEPASETTSEASEVFDIASNLMLAGGGAEKAIDTDYFTITLTHGSSWDYEIDSKTSITIYNIASREADCGGRLVSILAYDAGDTEYEVLPSYNVIGEKNGKVFIAEYPSDVQFDFNNEQAKSDYEAVFAEVQKIKEGAADSPLVLK